MSARARNPDRRGVYAADSRGKALGGWKRGTDVRSHDAEFGDGDFMLSLQVNSGTIHKHKVLAERFGTVAEFRAELRSGEQAPQHTQLCGWLG